MMSIALAQAGSISIEPTTIRRMMFATLDTFSPCALRRGLR